MRICRGPYRSAGGKISAIGPKWQVCVVREASRLALELKANYFPVMAIVITVCAGVPDI
jgi:hypothetical protein